MINGNYEGRKLRVGSDRNALIQVRGYAKHWTVTVLDGFYEVDAFDVSGDKHAVKRAVRQRGWLG